MKNFEGVGKYAFNPEKKFLEHADEKHEELLERKKLDREYQKEFSDFFLAVFEEVHINISDFVRDAFMTPSNIYCAFSNYLHRSITPNTPRDRLLLDRIVRECFYEYEKQHKIASRDECDEFITKAYAEKVDLNKLLSLWENETDEARKNLLLLIIQVVNPRAIPKTENEIEVKIAAPAVSAGGCVMAEKHMLAYISGKHSNPKGGYVNLIIDNNDSPLMLEKIGLGDSHSCISLKSVRINGVLIPAGAIFSAEPDTLEPIRKRMRWFIKRKERKGAINYVTKVNNYKGFKFVRMSLLSLPEEIRASAGGETYLHQQDKTKGYINYDWLTPEIIAQYASYRLKND